MSDPQTDPSFRAPTAREHKIAAGLFAGFGAFFILLFLAERGWGFRWVILALAGVSLWRALWHWTAPRPADQAGGDQDHAADEHHG